MSTNETAPTQFKTPKFRAGFVTLVEPKINEKSGKSEYSFTMLFPKDSDPELLMPFRRAAVAALKKMFGADKSAWPPRLRTVDLKTYISPGGDGWPLRDGDLQGYDGFEGMISIAAKSRNPIEVVDNMRNPITGDALRKIVSGWICKAVVNASPYNNSGNKGVSFWCNALQVIKDDGTRYGGRVSAQSAFDEEPDEDDFNNPDNYQPTGTGDEF